MAEDVGVGGDLWHSVKQLLSRTIEGVNHNCERVILWKAAYRSAHTGSPEKGMQNTAKHDPGRVRQKS